MAIEEGTRVKVWNGDRSKYLSLGTIQGWKTIEFIQLPDGWLSAGAVNGLKFTPEERSKLNEDAIQEEETLEILLDSGETTYGIKCWWDDVIEEDK